MGLFFKLECSPGCTGGLLSCKCEYLKDFNKRLIEGSGMVNTTDDPTEAIIISHIRSQNFLTRFGFTSVTVPELIELIKDIQNVDVQEKDFTVYVGLEDDSADSSRHSDQYGGTQYSTIEEYYYYEYGLLPKEKGDSTTHFSYI